MTGRRSEVEAAAVHTFRYRQSSLVGVALPRPPPPPPCMHRDPKASALRIPSHLATGCGARHRNDPTGGAANGSPLKTRTSALIPDVPDTRPASTRTGSEIAGAAERA